MKIETESGLSACAHAVVIISAMHAKYVLQLFEHCMIVNMTVFSTSTFLVAYRF